MPFPSQVYARRPSPARSGAGPEPIKALSVEPGGLEISYEIVAYRH